MRYSHHRHHHYHLHAMTINNMMSFVNIFILYFYIFLLPCTYICISIVFLGLRRPWPGPAVVPTCISCSASQGPCHPIHWQSITSCFTWQQKSIVLEQKSFNSTTHLLVPLRPRHLQLVYAFYPAESSQILAAVCQCPILTPPVLRHQTKHALVQLNGLFHTSH